MVYDSVHLPEEDHTFGSKPVGAKPERESVEPSVESTATLSVHRIRLTSFSGAAQ